MKLSAIPRMTVGLVSLAVLLLLLADLALGLFPSEASTRKQINTRVAQNLALQVASLLQKRDWTAVEQSLRAVHSGSPELASIGLRRTDGRLLAQSGPHARGWSGEGSALSQDVTVPLLSNGQSWGQLELAYKPLGLADLPGWMFSGPARLVLLFGLAASCIYYLYLRRMLEHLDPAAAVPDRVRSAFDSLVEGVLVVDLAGRILLVNKAFEALRPPGDERALVGLRAQALTWLQPAEGGTDAAPWLSVVGHNAKADNHPNSSGTRAQRFVVRAPGELMPLAHLTLNCSPLFDEQNALRGCLISLGDVTALEQSHRQLMDVLADLAMSKNELVEKNATLEQLANHDMLSGCLNRRAFFELGQALVDRALFDSAPLVCVMADIDHFKRINDTYGHGVGDQAIQRFAELLRQQVRPGDLLGRYGGEEFCLILPGANAAHGMNLAERLRQTVASNNGLGLDPGAELVMTASFGVALLGQDSKRLAQLIDHADHAMYVAKKGGRNRVVLAAADASVNATPSARLSAGMNAGMNAAPPNKQQTLPVLTDALQRASAMEFET